MRGQWTLLCKGNLGREISMYNQALSSLNLRENRGGAGNNEAWIQRGQLWNRKTTVRVLILNSPKNMRHGNYQ